MAANLDKISIKDLAVRCIVGVYPQERREKQDISININLYGDISAACRSDNIEDTIDYKSIKKRILALIENSDFLLIERLAECVAEICFETARVQRVEVEVDKPSALRFARSASVMISRERPRPIHRIYIGVSANIEPERNIVLSLELVSRQVRLTGISGFYWTDPIDRSEQPQYLNGAIRAETALDARALKCTVLREVEELLGRTRTGDAYAARPIDLDILLFDNLVIEDSDLRVPDPDIRARGFLAAALHDLDADLVLPDTGERVAELACFKEGGALLPNEAFTERLKRRYGL